MHLENNRFPRTLDCEWDISESCRWVLVKLCGWTVIGACSFCKRKWIIIRIQHIIINLVKSWINDAVLCLLNQLCQWCVDVCCVYVYSSSAVEPMLSLCDWLDGIQKTVKHSMQQCRDPESHGLTALHSLLSFSSQLTLWCCRPGTTVIIVKPVMHLLLWMVSVISSWRPVKF